MFVLKDFNDDYDFIENSKGGTYLQTSPFGRKFMDISNEVERIAAIETHTGVDNCYYYPQIISKLLTNYMPLAPL